MKRDSESGTHLPWEVLVLMLGWVVAGQFSPASVDSVRDIYQAHGIASGAILPLEGPQLAHTVHLGPLWFYMLAIPAALSEGWGGITLVVFLLSALKFWLSFVLGRNLHSSQLGLLFALFLALPSWSSTQLIIWTHTSVLETAVLLYLLSLRKSCLEPGPWRWLLTGIAFSLALHAHPTAVVFGLLLLPAWRPLTQRWYWTIWLISGVAVPFIPYVIDQVFNGFTDLNALQRYHAEEFSPGGPAEALRLLYSIVVTGPNLFYETVLPAPLASFAKGLHWLFISTVLVSGLWGWRRNDPGLKRLMMHATVMFVLIIIVVILIRARTPWHLAYAGSFALSFCYAVLATMAFRSFSPAIVRATTSAIILPLFFATVIAVSYRLYSNSIRFQESVLFDVKNLSGEWGPSGLEIPAFTSKEHGRYLCRLGQVVLHGPYAAMVDAHVGLEAEMSCGGRDDILIGGVTSEPEFFHLAGVTEAMSEALGSPPHARVGNVHFYVPLAISDAGKSIELAEGDKNPPRRFFGGGNPDVQILALENTFASALLISKAVGRFMGLDIREVHCNGKPANLAIAINYSSLYLCGWPSQDQSTRWRVWYVSSANDLVDAVLLPVANE